MMTSQAAAPVGAEIRRLTLGDVELFAEIRAEAVQKYPQTFWSLEEDLGGEARVAAYRHWLSGTLLGAFESLIKVGIAGFYVSSDKR